MTDGKRIDLLRNFIVVQPAPLWSDFSLTLDARSSTFTAFSNSRVKESTAFDFSVSRLPWGDRIHLDGEGLEQSENFAFRGPANKQLGLRSPLAFGADLGGVAGSLCCGSPVNPSSPSLLPLSRIGSGALRPPGDRVRIPTRVHRYGCGRSWAYLVGHYSLRALVLSVGHGQRSVQIIRRFPVLHADMNAVTTTMNALTDSIAPAASVIKLVA